MQDTLLCITIPKTSAYGRGFDETKYMSLLKKDDEYLEQYKKTWDKVSNSIKKGFDSECVYIEKQSKN